MTEWTDFVFWVIVEACGGYLLSNRAFDSSDEAYASDEFKNARGGFKEVEKTTIAGLKDNYGADFKDMVW